MKHENINAPNFGEAIAATFPSKQTLRMLRLRRSTPVEKLMEPGPNKTELDEILEIARGEPDHGAVAPFRFIVLQDDARRRAGTILRNAFQRTSPDAPDLKLDLEESRFQRAPVVIAVISAVKKEHRTPEWEQVLTVGAVCYNALLASSALGFAGQWLTEWYAYDEEVKAGFGLSADERFAGFIYLGTASEDPLERKRPVVRELVNFF